MSKSGRNSATLTDILTWLREGHFKVVNGEVMKGSKTLARHINKRRRSERGDYRVDLFYKGLHRGVLISHLVWMYNTNQILPENFQIHHIDNDPMNNEFSNLICVHPLDHVKLHASSIDDDDVPF